MDEAVQGKMSILYFFSLNFIYMDKFKVIPNLSLRSKDLAKRVKNKSIVFSTAGKVYVTDKSLVKALGLDKVQLHRDNLEGFHQIGDLAKKVYADALEKKRVDDVKAYEALIEQGVADKMKEVPNG